MNKLITIIALLPIAGAPNAQLPTKLKVVEELKAPVITKNHEDVIASNYKSGFETGHVVKIDDTYHMFVNEMWGRSHRDMRISYWTSTDAMNWKRQSTI